MRIRVATREDIPVLTALHAEGFSHYWDASAFNDFFAIAGTVALIAEIDHEPVGMLVYSVICEQSDIITVVIRSSHQQKGLAAALLNFAMTAAASKGAKDMFLDVEEGNVTAIKLYKNFGFNQINRRKLYYRQKNGSYTDALVMTRKLA